MKRDEAVPLRDALAAVTRDLGMPANDTLQAVTDAWIEVAGPELAAHARVRALRSGECTIEVDGPAWATRARYLGSALEQAANRRLGGPVFASLKVVVSGRR